jgi:hypothetical protein
MKRILLLFCILTLGGYAHSQTWETNVLNPGGFGFSFGNAVNQPINIFTNINQSAQFSTGYSLGPGIIPSANMGDGLRIIPRTKGCGSPSLRGTGALDLWTGRFNH